jgi:hypothetical protein
MAASTPRPFANAKNHKLAKEAIAEETHTSFAEVERIYDEELSHLQSEAKITQFLGVLTTRRVRMKLRDH